MDVVVVESPTKAKTINKYLGSNYRVLSSYGHVRDLPEKDGSVLPEEDFRIIYEPLAEKRQRIKAIAEALHGARHLYLATDPDREGEAISWHLLAALKDQGAINGVAVKRVVFHEITKRAVLEAMQHPRDLDVDLIDAYQARRALDYLVGFTLSPVLWRKLHGYYLVTGRPQAVMVHVNVGTANALMGLLNAARDNVPIFFTSGRTPVTDGGRLGARDLPIHWGQEMYDQAGMLREYVKWDYELRYGEQVERIVDRALAIAMSEPRGPVYLSLPREALATPVENFSYGEQPVMRAPAAPWPAPAAIEQAADILAAAERPLLIAGRGPSTEEGYAALAGFAERFAVPVAHFWPSRLALPTDHPMHVGFDSGPWLADADAVVVLDAMVPWIPKGHTLPEGCPVVQIGPDPLFADLPMRSFPASLAIAAAVPAALDALGAALAARGLDIADATTRRRERITERNADRREALRATIEAARGTPMGPAWISHCIDRVKGPDAVLFNELACDPAALTFSRPRCYFSHSLAGGLGWGLPAALGAKLALRDRLVIAAVGDGSYMFANPVACHQVSEALRLPVLTVVFNNGVWNAVRKTTRAVYPDGFAARSNRMPLASLEPSPAYEKIVEASNGYGERVEAADDLPAALERALHAVKEEQRQALLNVVCS